MMHVVASSGATCLDEDIADTAAAGAGIAVRPHDAHGLAIERLVVESLQRLLSCKEMKLPEKKMTHWNEIRCSTEAESIDNVRARVHALELLTGIVIRSS